MKRGLWIAAAVGGSLSLAALALFVASVATGRGIEATLSQELHAPERPAGLQLLELDHHTGWLTSYGHAEVRIAMGCGPRNRARAPLFHVDYSFEHWPSFSGPVRFEARAQPLSAFGEDLRSVAGADHVVEAHGVRDYQGSSRIALTVPPRSFHKPSGVLELAEAHGTIVLAGEGLEIEFRQPRLVVSKNGWQADARDVTLAWKLRDRHKIVGSTQTTAAAVSSSFGAAEGVAIGTRGAELNGRVELHVTAAAKRLIGDGKVLYDAAFQADASGLDAYSFAELSQSFRENCSAVAMAVDPSNRTRDAARYLLQRGFSLSISKLAARSDDGSLAGDLNLELRPAGQVALATQLRSIGQLTLLGPTLTSAGQQNFSLRQFLRPIPGGMRASYSFDNGSFIVNDKTWSPILVRIALNIFDSALLAL